MGLEKQKGLFLDEKTNEARDVELLIKTPKLHFKKGEFYMQTFNLDELILDKNYTLPELKTLIALKKRLDFNNRIKSFRQADIAEEIRSSQPNVSRAIKRLEQDKIIKKDGLDWYFSDEFIKGSGETRGRKSKKYSDS